MPIVPDEKDWTWVLGRPCPECSFDAAAVTPSTVPGSIDSMLPALARGPAAPGCRGAPQ